MPNSRKPSNKARHIFLFLRIAVAVAAILWVFRGQKWSELVKTFAGLNLWYFAFSLAIFIVSQILVGLRWWLLLRAQSIFIDFWAAVRLHFLGLFYNNLMPSSIGGDLIRAWYVTKHTDKKLEAAMSVFADRIIGLLGLVIIAVFCYSIFMRGRGGLVTSSNDGGFLKSIAAYQRFVFWLTVVLAAIFCLLLLNVKTRAMMKKAWSYICVHSAKAIKKLIEAVIIYCSKPLTILAVVALTIFLQTQAITAFWLLGVNLDIDAGARYYYVFFPLTWVIGALPISIAGIGILEGGLREFFTRFAGVSVEQVLALALCQRFIFVLASLPGAVIHMFGAHLPKDFSIDCNKSID